MIVKNIEKKEDNKYASFQVEVSPEEFEAAVNKAYLRNKKDIAVTGFRKGKAPRAVVEGMYGADVFYREAMDDLGPAAFEFGYDNCGLKIIGRPSISDVDLSDEKVLTYTFAVELYPEVTLGQYKNLSAPKREAVLDETQFRMKSMQFSSRMHVCSTLMTARHSSAIPQTSTLKASSTASHLKAARASTSISSSAPALSFPALKSRLSV